MDPNVHIHSTKSSYSWHVLMLLIPVIIFATIVAFFVSRGEPAPLALSAPEPQATILINNHTITADIADTDQERQLGLGGRQSLTDDQGLLFVFTHAKGIPGFWMKEMLIPIDIIWIKDNKVVHIDKNVEPQPNIADNALTIYSAPGILEDIDYILEVPAGFSDRYQVTLETPINLSELSL